MTEPVMPETYEQKREFIQAMAQLDSKEKEIKSSPDYLKAYLWSVFIPPIGIYYFIKYFFTGGDTKAIKAGFISLLLTLISLFLSLWLTAELFKQLTVINSSPNSQILKEIAVPENQKTLLELFK